MEPQNPLSRRAKRQQARIDTKCYTDTTLTPRHYHVDPDEQLCQHLQHTLSITELPIKIPINRITGLPVKLQRPPLPVTVTPTTEITTDRITNLPVELQEMIFTLALKPAKLIEEYRVIINRLAEVNKGFDRSLVKPRLDWTNTYIEALEDRQRILEVQTSSWLIGIVRAIGFPPTIQQDFCNRALSKAKACSHVDSRLREARHEKDHLEERYQVGRKHRAIDRIGQAAEGKKQAADRDKQAADRNKQHHRNRQAADRHKQAAEPRIITGPLEILLIRLLMLEKHATYIVQKCFKMPSKKHIQHLTSAKTIAVVNDLIEVRGHCAEIRIPVETPDGRSEYVIRF